MALKTFITGADELSKTFDVLGLGMRTDLAGDAVEAVGSVLLNSMRFLVPVRHGALRQSLNKKLVKYPQTAGAVVIVGATRKLRFTTPDGTVMPSKYMHLVEFGHVDKGGKFHPPQHPFIRPAVDAVAPMAGDIMAKEMSAGIERLVKKAKRGAN